MTFDQKIIGNDFINERLNKAYNSLVFRVEWHIGETFYFRYRDLTSSL